MKEYGVNLPFRCTFQVDYGRTLTLHVGYKLDTNICINRESAMPNPCYSYIGHVSYQIVSNMCPTRT